jgi:hypothetical protein
VENTTAKSAINNLRDRIADTDEKHYQMLATDGGWLCACGHRFSGNTYREWRLHKADAVIRELGLKVASVGKFRTVVMGGYVTEWETDEDQ